MNKIFSNIKIEPKREYFTERFKLFQHGFIISVEEFAHKTISDVFIYPSVYSNEDNGLRDCNISQ